MNVMTMRRGGALQGTTVQFSSVRLSLLSLSLSLFLSLSLSFSLFLSFSLSLSLSLSFSLSPSLSLSLSPSLLSLSLFFLCPPLLPPLSLSLGCVCVFLGAHGCATSQEGFIHYSQSPMSCKGVVNSMRCMV